MQGQPGLQAPASNLQELLKEIKELKAGLLVDSVTHDNPTFEGPPWANQQTLQNGTGVHLDVPIDDLDDSLEDLVARDTGLQYILSPQAEAQVARSAQPSDSDSLSSKQAAPALSGIGRGRSPTGIPSVAGLPAALAAASPPGAVSQAPPASASVYQTPIALRVPAAFSAGLAQTANATNPSAETTPTMSTSSGQIAVAAAAIQTPSTSQTRSKIGSRIAMAGAAVAAANTTALRTPSASSSTSGLSLQPTPRSGAPTQIPSPATATTTVATSATSSPPQTPSAAATPREALSSSTQAVLRTARQKTAAAAATTSSRSSPRNVTTTAGRHSSNSGLIAGSSMVAARSSTGSGSSTSSAVPAAASGLTQPGLSGASARKRLQQSASEFFASTPGQKGAAGTGYGALITPVSGHSAAAGGSTLKQGRATTDSVPTRTGKKPLAPARALQSTSASMHSGSTGPSPPMSPRTKRPAMNTAAAAQVRSSVGRSVAAKSSPSVSPGAAMALGAVSPSLTGELECEVSHRSLTLPSAAAGQDMLTMESLEDLFAEDPCLAASARGDIDADVPALRRRTSYELLQPLVDAMAGGAGNSDWMDEDADEEMELLLQSRAGFGRNGDLNTGVTPEPICVSAGALTSRRATTLMSPELQDSAGGVAAVMPFAAHSRGSGLTCSAASGLLAAASLRASQEPMGSTLCKVRELLGLDGPAEQHEQDSKELNSEELWRNISADANHLFTEHQLEGTPGTSATTAISAAVAMAREPSAPFFPDNLVLLEWQGSTVCGVTSYIAQRSPDKMTPVSPAGRPRSLTVVELVAAATGDMQCESLETDDGFLGHILADEADAAAATVVAAGLPPASLLAERRTSVMGDEGEAPPPGRRLQRQNSSTSSFGFDATVALEATLISRQLAGGLLGLRTQVGGGDAIMEVDEAPSPAGTPKAVVPSPLLLKSSEGAACDISSEMKALPDAAKGDVDVGELVVVATTRVSETTTSEVDAGEEPALTVPTPAATEDIGIPLPDDPSSCLLEGSAAVVATAARDTNAVVSAERAVQELLNARVEVLGQCGAPAGQGLAYAIAAAEAVPTADEALAAATLFSMESLVIHEGPHERIGSVTDAEPMAVDKSCVQAAAELDLPEFVSGAQTVTTASQPQATIDTDMDSPDSEAASVSKAKGECVPVADADSPAGSQPDTAVEVAREAGTSAPDQMDVDDYEDMVRPATRAAFVAAVEVAGDAAAEHPAAKPRNSPEASSTDVEDVHAPSQAATDTAKPSTVRSPLTLSTVADFASTAGRTPEAGAPALVFAIELDADRHQGSSDLDMVDRGGQVACPDVDSPPFEKEPVQVVVEVSHNPVADAASLPSMVPESASPTSAVVVAVSLPLLATSATASAQAARSTPAPSLLTPLQAVANVSPCASPRALSDTVATAAMLQAAAESASPAAGPTAAGATVVEETAVSPDACHPLLAIAPVAAVPTAAPLRNTRIAGKTSTLPAAAAKSGEKALPLHAATIAAEELPASPAAPFTVVEPPASSAARIPVAEELLALSAAPVAQEPPASPDAAPVGQPPASLAAPVAVEQPFSPIASSAAEQPTSPAAPVTETLPASSHTRADESLGDWDVVDDDCSSDRMEALIPDTGASSNTSDPTPIAIQLGLVDDTTVMEIDAVPVSSFNDTSTEALELASAVDEEPLRSSAMLVDIASTVPEVAPVSPTSVDAAMAVAVEVSAAAAAASYDFGESPRELSTGGNSSALGMEATDGAEQGTTPEVGAQAPPMEDLPRTLDMLIDTVGLATGTALTSQRQQIGTEVVGATADEVPEVKAVTQPAESEDSTHSLECTVDAYSEAATASPDVVEGLASALAMSVAAAAISSFPFPLHVADGAHLLPRRSEEDGEAFEDALPSGCASTAASDIGAPAAGVETHSVSSQSEVMPFVDARTFTQQLTLEAAPEQAVRTGSGATSDIKEEDVDVEEQMFDAEEDGFLAEPEVTKGSITELGTSIGSLMDVEVEQVKAVESTSLAAREVEAAAMSPQFESQSMHASLGGAGGPLSDRFGRSTLSTVNSHQLIDIEFEAVDVEEKAVEHESAVVDGGKESDPNDSDGEELPHKVSFGAGAAVQAAAVAVDTITLSSGGVVTEAVCSDGCAVGDGGPDAVTALVGGASATGMRGGGRKRPRLVSADLTAMGVDLGCDSADTTANAESDGATAAAKVGSALGADSISDNLGRALMGTFNAGNRGDANGGGMDVAPLPTALLVQPPPVGVQGVQAVDVGAEVGGPYSETQATAAAIAASIVDSAAAAIATTEHEDSSPARMSIGVTKEAIRLTPIVVSSRAASIPASRLVSLPLKPVSVAVSPRHSHSPIPENVEVVADTATATGADVAGNDGYEQPMQHAWQVLAPLTPNGPGAEPDTAVASPSPNGSLGARRSLRKMLSGSSRLSRVTNRTNEDESAGTGVESPKAGTEGGCGTEDAAGDEGRNAGQVSPAIALIKGKHADPIETHHEWPICAEHADLANIEGDVEKEEEKDAFNAAVAASWKSEDAAVISPAATATEPHLLVVQSSNKSGDASQAIETTEQLMPAWKVMGLATIAEASCNAATAQLPLGTRRSLRSMPLATDGSRLQRSSSQSSLSTTAASMDACNVSDGMSTLDGLQGALSAVTALCAIRKSVSMRQTTVGEDEDSDDEQAPPPAWKVVALPLSAKDSPNAVAAARSVPLGSQPSFRSCRAGSSRLHRTSAPDADDFDFVDTVGGTASEQLVESPPSALQVEGDTLSTEHQSEVAAAPVSEEGKSSPDMVETGVVLVLGRSRSHSYRSNSGAGLEAVDCAQPSTGTDNFSADGMSPPPFLRHGSTGRTTSRIFSGSQSSIRGYAASENGSMVAAGTCAAHPSSRRFAPETVGSVPLPRRSVGSSDPNVDAMRPAWQVLLLPASPVSPSGGGAEASIGSAGLGGGCGGGGSPNASASIANMLVSMRSSSRLSRMSSGIPEDLLAELKLQAFAAVGHLQGLPHGNDSGGGLADMDTSMEESAAQSRLLPAGPSGNPAVEGDGEGGVVHAWKVLPLRRGLEPATVSLLEGSSAAAVSGSNGSPLPVPCALASRSLLTTTRHGNQSSRFAVSTKAPVLQVSFEPASSSCRSPRITAMPEVDEEDEQEPEGHEMDEQEPELGSRHSDSADAAPGRAPVWTDNPAELNAGGMHAWKLALPANVGSASLTSSPAVGTVAATVELTTLMDGGGNSGFTTVAIAPVVSPRPHPALGSRPSLKSMGSPRGSRLSRASLAVEDYVDESYTALPPATGPVDDDGNDDSSDERPSADRIAPANAANQSAIAAAAAAAAAAVAVEDAEKESAAASLAALPKHCSDGSSARAAIEGLPSRVINTTRVDTSGPISGGQHNDANRMSTPGSTCDDDVSGLEDSGGVVPDSPMTHALNTRPSLRTSRSSNGSRLSRLNSLRDGATTPTSATASAVDTSLGPGPEEQDDSQAVGVASSLPPLLPESTVRAVALSPTSLESVVQGARLPGPTGAPAASQKGTRTSSSSRLSRVTSIVSDVGLRGIVEESLEGPNTVSAVNTAAVVNFEVLTEADAHDHTGGMPYERASSLRAPPPAPSAGAARIGAPAAVGPSVPETRGVINDEEEIMLLPAWKVLLPSPSGAPTVDTYDNDVGTERTSQSALPFMCRQPSLRSQRSGSLGSSRLRRVTSGMDSQAVEVPAEEATVTAVASAPSVGIAIDGGDGSTNAGFSPSGDGAHTRDVPGSRPAATTGQEAVGVLKTQAADPYNVALPPVAKARGISTAEEQPGMPRDKTSGTAEVQSVDKKVAEVSQLEAVEASSPRESVGQGEALATATSAQSPGTPGRSKGRGLFSCLGCFGGSAVEQ